MTMDPKLLDELVVPQPPYRMARPQVVLAMADVPQKPPIPSSEPPAPVPSETTPEREPSLDEMVEREVQALEATAAEEEAKLERATAPVGATPQEAAGDASSRDEALRQVRAVADEEMERLRAIVRGAGEKPIEEMTPEQREANQAFAAKLREKQAAEIQRRAQEALAKLNEFRDAQQRQKIGGGTPAQTQEAGGTVAQAEQPPRTPPPPPPPMPPLPSLEELEEVEAEPPVGTLVPGKGVVTGYEESGKATYEPEPKGVGYDEEGKPIAVPLETVEQKVDANLKAADESLERIRALEDERKRKDEEIAALKKELEDAKTREKEGKVAGMPEGQAMKAVRDVLELERMGNLIDLAKPEEWKMLKNEASGHDLSVWWYSIWAKRAKDKLEGKDKTIAELEKKAAAYAEKSWVGTALSPIVFGSRLVWHKWRRGIYDESHRKNHTRRSLHEDLRNEALNQMAQNLEPSLRNHERKVKEAEADISNLESNLDALNDEMHRLSLLLAAETDTEKKRLAIAEIGKRKTLYEQYVRELKALQQFRKEHEDDLLRLRKATNELLQHARPGDLAETEPKERKYLRPRQKRKGEPLTEAA